LNWQAEKVVSTRKHITEGGIKDQSAFDKITEGGIKDQSAFDKITEGGIKDQSGLDKFCADTTFENESVEKCTLNANNSNIDLEKIRTFIASKGKILSQTAVNALKRKRNTLVKPSYINQ
jgi:hypothetical protein